MNSSELPAIVIDAIVKFHHISGAIFFIVNILVCSIIAFDNDNRAKVYRKYVISLQLSSTMVDLFCNMYSPIFMINCRLVFSDSFVAQYINLAAFGAIEVGLFGCVANSYFACVYYRRNAVLPPGSRFCFVGWRRTILFLSLQAFTLINTFVFFFLTNNVMSEQVIPTILNWVTFKSSFIFFHDSNSFFIGGAVTITYYLGMAVVLAVMICQVLMELKHGMNHASPATKRYQKRAVVSLACQGAIPKIIYIAPIIAECVLYLNTARMGLEMATRQQTISIASSFIFAMLTTHTVLHSLTVLACSPVYRKTLLDLILLPCRRSSRLRASQITSVQLVHSISNHADK